MAGKNLDYWYDEQIKRYLIQLVRVFSNFKVKENTKNGVKYNRVPARYGDMSRMVASILRNNSENVVNNAPMITVSINSIQPARDRTAEPFLIDTRQVAEREFDKQNNVYTSEQGNLYTTQRYMPVPYNLTIQVDIWTTNTDSKLQILEQLFVIFNPSIQLQSNDNPLDWTSVFELELTDINWSSRSIPAGVDENLDIATMTFVVPIWISPPAKVKRQTIIQQIVADVHKVNNVSDLGYSKEYYDFFGTMNKDAEIIVTPGDYRVQIAGATAKLVKLDGNYGVWQDIIEMAGELTATSLLKLNIASEMDPESEVLVVGSVSANPSDETSLIFNLDVDTLPADTLSEVDKIIDPRASSPGVGLGPAVLGQRYLITETISASGYPAWNIDANENDIIQYDGSSWQIAFNSNAVTSVHYVTNDYTSKQYKWTGSSWISSYEGEYNPGYWRLVL
jgi:hypothetical protein